MGDKLKENWYIIVFSAFVGTIISLTLTSAVVKLGKIDDAVPLSTYNKDKEQFEIKRNEYFESSKKYTDDRFNDHILTEQQAFNNLEKLTKSYLNELKAIIEGNAKYMESVDRRLERIENKQ